MVVTYFHGCSYEKKARHAQQVNASALILVHREVRYYGDKRYSPFDQIEEGFLFSPLPELSYYTAPESESINIPVMIIKKTDGDLIYNKLNEGGAFMSIYCAKTGNRSLIHAWNLYWIWWLIAFTILLFLSIASFIIMSREPKLNILIKPCIGLTMLCAVGTVLNAIYLSLSSQHCRYADRSLEYSRNNL